MEVEATFRHVGISVGVRLHVVEAGPEDGPMVVLLHGFPEFWYGWREQIPALAAAGCRVVVPDQRGFNLSDKPRWVWEYRMEELVDDVRVLIEQCGRSSATVVGHDLGGVVAWFLALWQPSVVERLVILNAPHPLAFSQLLPARPSQMVYSWYIALFQLPYLPEAVSRLTGWRILRQALLASSRSDAFSRSDLDEYREAWERDGAFQGMLNWYRALVRHAPPIPEDPRVKAPTRVIWGERDDFLVKELARESIRFCDRAELIMLPNATHWLQHEEPHVVNDAILGLLEESLALDRT